MIIWEKYSRWNCEGSETGVCMACLKNSKEANVARME